MKRAVLFDPYLDTLGGGERYTLTIAEILQKHAWQVTLAWTDQSTLAQASNRFGLDLSKVQVNPQLFTLFSRKQNLYSRWLGLKDFDLVFVVSDGSVPILFGKKTLLHYQVPFTKTNRLQILNKLKLASIDHLVVNSLFTKRVIDRLFGTIRSEILYPPIDTSVFKSAKKENIILNVGRFASPSHSKRQDILINAFKELTKIDLKDWKLVLAGGKFGKDSVLGDLKDQARGYPIDFVINPDFKELQKLYSKASIYWHAAGYEVDENINPEAVEHFGITTVEAMAAGCVPVVINKGGQPEIVTLDTGFLWNTQDQLISLTKQLIASKSLMSGLSKASINRAKIFDKETFTNKFIDLI